MVTKQLKEILRGELIGKTIEIVDSTNQSLKGIKGVVIDETKNMLIIQKQEKTLRIIKKQATLKINDQQINGELLSARPEERIKISIKKITKIQRLVKRNAK